MEFVKGPLVSETSAFDLRWLLKTWRGDCQKGYCNGGHQGEGSEADPNLPGRRGLEERWQKRGYKKRIGQMGTIGGGR
jgi:hypothetical protein